MSRWERLSKEAKAISDGMRQIAEKNGRLDQREAVTASVRRNMSAAITSGTLQRCTKAGRLPKGGNGLADV